MHKVRFDLFSIHGFSIQLMQQGFRRLYCFWNTADLKFIAPAAYSNPQPAFEMFDVLIYGPDQGGQAPRVVGFEADFFREGSSGI